MRSHRRLDADARRISAALAWQVREKRLSILPRTSPLAVEPARDAARLLDRCLRSLAREEARTRLRLGRLLAIFGRVGALTKLGFVRKADYVSERLGISGSEADVTQRVTRRLDGLPSLRAALLDGRIDWTKARILSAVASADTEARWLETAAGKTVREVEALVAQEGPEAANEVAPVREDHADETDGEPRARFRIRAPGWAWLLFRRVVALARSASGEASMPVWKAAEAIAAEGQALAGPKAFSEEVEGELLWLASRRRGAPASSEKWRPVPAAGARDELDLEALLPEAARWLGVAEAELRRLLPARRVVDREAELATPPVLDARLREEAAALRTLDVRVGRALHLFSERRLYRELGFFDLESYVTERLGIGLRKARSLIALDRAAESAPPLRAAYDDGRISWVRAIALLPVIESRRRRPGGQWSSSPEGPLGSIEEVAEASVAAWVARASEVTVRRLVDEVAWALERKVAGEGPERSASPPPLGARLEPVQMRVNENDAAADAVVEFWGPVSVVAALERLTVAFGEANEPLWKGLVRLLAAVARGWQAEGRRHRDPIVERDGWRCAAPGCGSRRNLQVHHVVFRSRGGGDEESNLATVCAAHHHRCIHTYDVVLRGRAPDDLEWTFGAAGSAEPILRLKGEVYA